MLLAIFLLIMFGVLGPDPEFARYFGIFLQHCGAEAAFLERYPTPFLQTHRAVWTLEIPTVERLVMAYSNSSVVIHMSIL